MCTGRVWLSHDGVRVVCGVVVVAVVIAVSRHFLLCVVRFTWQASGATCAAAAARQRKWRDDEMSGIERTSVAV